MTRAYNRDAHQTRAQTDDIIRSIFGVDGRDELDASQEKTFPDYALSSAQKIIDGEWGGVDIAAKHAAWARFEAWRRGPGGRPATVSGRTVLIALLMHAIANEPMSIKHIAHTFVARLTPAQRKTLGIADCTFDGISWYNRLRSAYQQLLEPIDPCPYPDYPRGDTTPAKERITLQRKLTATQREWLNAWRAKIQNLLDKRRTRLDDLMFEMNANFIRHVQATSSLLDDFTGDVALDATFTLVHGRGTSPDSTRVAGSTNLEAGWYIRDGNHAPTQTTKPALKAGKSKVKTVTKRKFGFETDLVTMTNGDKLVPDFILGVNLHRPGAITEVARTLFSRIPRLGFDAGNISVDMAYPYLEPQSFHIPLMQAGYDFVFHIRDGELGAQAAYSVKDKPTTLPDGTKKETMVGFIHVEGSWYLDHMPENIANAVIHSRLDPSHEDYIDEETLKARLKTRSEYRLVRHGRRKEDGTQRYMLPAPGTYLPKVLNAQTGEVAPIPKITTVTIPLSVGIKQNQKYEYLSPEWQIAFNLRSGIERKNRQLKLPAFESLNDPDRRPARGYAPHALAVSMIVVAHNLRTLDAFLRTAEGIDTKKSRTRRKDAIPENELLQKVRKQRDGRRAA